ncbi:hypothetical protein F5Y07DRAFT_115804 [Xylaria sp. FL0933]|nr:hypothetical protein F5Y07DRAFT_115804 [Xylaria sp. FL0933]
MPSATQSVFSMVSPSARKRRRGEDGEVQMSLYDTSQNTLTLVMSNLSSRLTLRPNARSSTLETSQNLLSATTTTHNNERLIVPSNRGSASLFSVPRKAIPLPVSKKFRLLEENSRETNNHNFHHNSILPSTVSHSQPSHFSHAHPDLTTTASASPPHTRPASTRANSSALLSPCHICHRKPTKKSDLDSFADCTGCGERTCFVCIRACQGWLPVSEGDDATHTLTEEEDLSASFTMRDIDDDESGHNRAEKFTDVPKPEQRQKKGEGGDYGEGGWSGGGHREVICSRCCVERGGEGDVVCLGCLAGMRGA